VTVTGFFLFSGRRNSFTFDLRFREELSDLSRICVCVHRQEGRQLLVCSQLSKCHCTQVATDRIYILLQIIVQCFLKQHPKLECYLKLWQNQKVKFFAKVSAIG